MKKIKLLLFTLVLFFCFCISTNASTNTFTRTKDKPLVPKSITVTDGNINSILSTPAVDSNEKVYDYANLFSIEEEEKIYKRIKAYLKKTSNDVVIVTVDDLKDISLKDYSYNFYNYNDFAKDGLILIINQKQPEPSIYMGVSDGISNVYTSENINDILKYIYDNIYNKKYSTAVNDYLDIVEGLYGLDSSGKVDKNGKVVKKIPWIELIVLALALTFIVATILYYLLKNKCKKSTVVDINKHVNDETLVVKCNKDALIDDSANNTSSISNNVINEVNNINNIPTSDTTNNINTNPANTEPENKNETSK